MPCEKTDRVQAHQEVQDWIQNSAGVIGGSQIGGFAGDQEEPEAGESTDLASTYNTSRVLYPILHFLMGLDPIRFLAWHFYIRKLGHFAGYFTLSLLLFRAWRATLRGASLSPWSIQWAGFAFFMAALVASLDEWHQTYLPSRTR